MQIVNSFDLRRGVTTVDRAFAQYIDDDSKDTDQLLRWLQISSPCHQSWDDMEGDDSKRLCLTCDKHVYNIEEMTRTEVIALMRSDEERKICKRIRKRFDGTVIMSDCPVGESRKQDRVFFLLTLLSWLMHPLTALMRATIESCFAPPWMGS